MNFYIKKMHRQGICWPPVVAPYRVAIVTMKGRGAAAASPHAVTTAHHLYDTLNSLPALRGDVLLDTRLEYTCYLLFAGLTQLSGPIARME